MKREIYLRPGTPNDANRDYLPEAIKGSDMVVNENGNNSQPYPQGLQEFHGCVTSDGLEDVWYEYVPESYDPSKKTPLVFSMHGGLMTGWGQCIYTSWTHIADREGFICVFPSAHARRFWQIVCEPELKEQLTAPNPEGIYMNPFPDDIAENHDANLVLGLLERMKEKYNIDEGRIYMQGMSLGNAMTSMMARFYAYKFAGMAGSAGPSRLGLLFNPDGTPNHEGGPVAAWQTRMELDGTPPGADGQDILEIVTRNRDYWLTINQCHSLPRIRVEGDDNFAFYTGEKADYVFRDVKNRDHGQTFDDAEWVWDYLFSGVRREADGAIVRIGTNLPTQGDGYALAFSEGCSKAWVNGRPEDMGAPAFRWQKLKYHGLNGGEIVRGEYMMAPLGFLAKVLGAGLKQPEDGAAVMTLGDGTTLQFARGSIGCVWNNRVRSMLCEAVERDGQLFIPVEWLFRAVLGKTASACGETVYVTDHDANLSIHMAKLLHDLLS